LTWRKGWLTFIDVEEGPAHPRRRGGRAGSPTLTWRKGRFTYIDVEEGRLTHVDVEEGPVHIH